MMIVHDTPHTLKTEKRVRMEQIEGIFRRLNPDLTDEELEDLVWQFWRQSGLNDL